VIPNIGRRMIELEDGQVLGRNGLISEFILRKTGKTRSRTQCASHVIILKKHHADDAARASVSPAFAAPEERRAPDLICFPLGGAQ
jgi:hypothetical protein